MAETFLRNCWYVAALDDEVARMRTLRRLILNEPVVLYRKRSGAPVALEDRCRHRQAPLSKGVVKGDDIECPYHGMRYAPDGRCVRIPSQDAIPDDARVRSWPVAERHGWIWIWMGDPGKADPGLIEDFRWRDDPGWRSKGELLPLKASYRLLVENLCDLTHVPFVHPTSLNETMIARGGETPVTTRRDGSSVAVERWEHDVPAPSYFRAMTGMSREDRVDRWLHLVYTPPAFVRLDIGAAPAGSRGLADDRSAHPTVRNLNAITPETERSTHYFWANAINYGLEDRSLMEIDYRMVHEAFLEDIEIIEAQQRNMDLGSFDRLNVAGDAGGVQAIRVLDEAIAAEGGALRAAG